MHRTAASFRGSAASPLTRCLLVLTLLSGIFSSVDAANPPTTKPPALPAAKSAARPRISPTSAPVPAYTLVTGEINGAQFTLARPTFWNARVLLIAHGLRAEDRPLVADLSPGHFSYRTLIEEGWIVATTSFRRNGIIVSDAVADLDALRSYIVQTYGTADRVIVEGESMGGLIGTLIAEREPEDPRLYAGVVAIGAALDVREGGATVGLSLHPKIPLLFLTNQSELGGPRAYVAAAAQRASGDAVPMLFQVSRDGHVNVNQRERLAALRALNLWLDHGRSVLPRPPEPKPFFDATVAPTPLPSSVAAEPDGRGFTARIIEVSPIYGNVFIDAQPADFAAAGITPGQWFELTVRDQKFRTRYGADFSSVKRNEWVVFPNADGCFWLARNFGDAAASANLKLGDTVLLRRFDETK